MNNALYEIASFMVMRESTVWRWSHNRHHSDTIIVGRDPEIAVPRPPDVTSYPDGLFHLRVYPALFQAVPCTASGACRGGEDFHSRERVSAHLSQCAHLRCHLCAVIALSIYERSVFRCCSLA